MRKSVVTLAFVCVLAFGALNARAGDPHQPGDNPNPTPTPCDDCAPLDGGGTNSAASGPSVTIVWINGVPFIVVI